MYRKHVLTHGKGPDSRDLDHGPVGGVGAAVPDGAADADVAVQRNGTQVHDGGGAEKHVQEDPHRTQDMGQRPRVIWIQECKSDLENQDLFLSCLYPVRFMYGQMFQNTEHSKYNEMKCQRQIDSN